MTKHFAPGDLVRARGREWMTLSSPAADVLRLRPLTGGEADAQLISQLLEDVDPASFAPPDPNRPANRAQARLLSDALRLSLRRGAGPFRSAGQVSFEPRAYQLVPLLMALRLDVVRLLIADDVGVGKTIEAGLILRELLDRGDIDRFTVLCPPHLVDQWVVELRTRFDLDAVAVTAATASGIERRLPTTTASLFEAHPFTVVSLDYIKADRRRARFVQTCPDTVVVDEAHGCVGATGPRQKRFEVLAEIAAKHDRNIVLLTATPHSGIAGAFDRLLGLLHEDFANGALEGSARDNRALLERLSQHFVQRRRIDVETGGWDEERIFAKHMKTDLEVTLTKEHLDFHDAVLDHCLGCVKTVAGTSKRRIAYWETLGLMRCVASSPAAAAAALRNRMGDLDETRVARDVADEEPEDGELTDVEPAVPGTGDAGRLATLLATAEKLAKKPDPKLQALVTELTPLIAKGANPVVFCRYVATTAYVGDELRKRFPESMVEVVTGLMTQAERQARVRATEDSYDRILVCTDCLSEGVNLQDLFDVVAHYDLSWNPTRHQQRDGRVSRYGQKSPVVHSITMFTKTPIDGAVLDVIVRKARDIEKTTGILVGVPEDKGSLAGALLNAMLLRRDGPSQRQLGFDFGLETTGEASNVDRLWRDVQEGEKKSTTRFAQRTMRPEEVIPEWERWRATVGDAADVERFVTAAMTHLGSPMSGDPGGVRTGDISGLPEGIRDRLVARGIDTKLRVTFDAKPVRGAETVNRAHALTSTLAEGVIADALDDVVAGPHAMGRCGTWRTTAVEAVTTVLVLRLRHKLTTRRRGRADGVTLAEEALVVALRRRGATLIGDEATALLAPLATKDIDGLAFRSTIHAALQRVTDASDELRRIARERAENLQASHEKVRERFGEVGARRTVGARTSVDPILPVDVVGLYVLQPHIQEVA